jgi:hypothetical protein
MAVEFSMSAMRRRQPGKERASQVETLERPRVEGHRPDEQGVSDDFSRLRRAIKRLHGCDSTHVATVSVADTFRGRAVWIGTVEIFSLRAHPKAKRCFAWSHFPERDWDSEVAVLEIPPIDSPLAAVRAVILAESKQAPN